MKRILFLTLAIALGLFASVSCTTSTTTTEKTLAFCGGPYQDDPSLPAWQDAWLKANTSLTFGSLCIDLCNDNTAWQELVPSPGCFLNRSAIRCSCADELSPVEDAPLLKKCQDLLAACVAANPFICNC